MTARKVSLTLRISLALALLVLAGPTFPMALAGDNDDRFYVSLGTSLAVGIQPDDDGINEETDEGYADQLLDILEDEGEDLELVRLGCDGETSEGMILGGDLSGCTYPAGSQLSDAVEFLEANRGSIALVTIDIGANDALDCSVSDLMCLFTAFGTVQANLVTTILPALRAAAGPDVPILGMNYYNPNLAFWINPGGLVGEGLAIASNTLAETFNAGFLAPAYASSAVPVADVFAAYQSRDFSPGPDLLPVNVSVICELTWMCDPERGPNIHANEDGYGVIAETFAALLGDFGEQEDVDDD